MYIFYCIRIEFSLLEFIKSKIFAIQLKLHEFSQKIEVKTFFAIVFMASPIERSSSNFNKLHNLRARLAKTKKKISPRTKKEKKKESTSFLYEQRSASSVDVHNVPPPLFLSSGTRVSLYVSRETYRLTLHDVTGLINNK